jgi:hypothetical protein
MRLFRAGAVPKRKFARRGVGVCSNRTNPALMISLKVFSIASVRAGARAEKTIAACNPNLVQKAHSPTFAHEQPTAVRPAAAVIVRHLLLARAEWRQRPAAVGVRAKMRVIANTYERRADGGKGCPGPCAPCFSPVINNEDGMRMLPARAAGKASGPAPGTSEKAVSPRALTDGERAFSLRRRGGSLTSHRPHASSRGYLSRCARSAFASSPRTNTRPE